METIHTHHNVIITSAMERADAEGAGLRPVKVRAAASKLASAGALTFEKGRRVSVTFEARRAADQ